MTQDADTLDELASTLINRYQGNVPLQTSPFAEMADELCSTESEILQTVTGLLDAGWLTRFGPLYDAAALGGGLTLAALAAPEKYYNRVADIVNRYPQVAHNYRREHALNMWFVLATETPEEIDSTISSLQHETGLTVYNFPKQHEYYVGLWLQLDKAGVSTLPVPVNTMETCDYVAMTIDRQIIQHTQAGLPLVEQPYAMIAQTLGCDTETVIARLQHMLASGIIRRIGVVPNHIRLGLRANGMSVWDVADDKIEKLGNLIGSFDFVSHCYQRPRHLPQWSYNLFAMVHGHDRAEVSEKVARIAQLLGDDCHGHDVLYSSAILKKSGMRLAA